jgi:hypothetical protein
MIFERPAPDWAPLASLPFRVRAGFRRVAIDPANLDTVDFTPSLELATPLVDVSQAMVTALETGDYGALIALLPIALPIGVRHG